MSIFYRRLFDEDLEADSLPRLVAATMPAAGILALGCKLPQSHMILYRFSKSRRYLSRKKIIHRYIKNLSDNFDIAN